MEAAAARKHNNTMRCMQAMRHEKQMANSTCCCEGVIGRRIKLQALLDSVPKLVSNLGPSAEDAHHAAVGITTTDLVSKSAAIEVNVSNPQYCKQLPSSCIASVTSPSKVDEATSFLLLICRAVLGCHCFFL